jgi:hypothetical protein
VQATDLLLMLMGPASYQTLVVDYGWTHAQWREWCRRAIAQQLFASEGGPKADETKVAR